MVTFLKTAAVIACMILIVPAAVWAGTGSRARAWEATKGYLLVMGIIVGLGLTFSGISILVSRLS
jgi:hypothetical protein